MKDERPCDKCIFHDGNCTRWECRPITRHDAELAFDIIGEFLNEMDKVLVGDTKEVSE